MEVDQAYTDTAEKWALDYLSEYYGTVGETHCFALKSLHRFYSTYQPPAGGAKVLDFGGGPALSHLISAAPKCKEVVFAEFADDCREHINLWLKRDPAAFDWRPFFSYVVDTLEGGTEKDIVDREEMLRSILKSVTPCDIFKPQPLEDPGPYDIIFSGLCLEYICPSYDSYRESVAKLARLLKPGGTLLMRSGENSQSFTHLGKMMRSIPISRQFACDCLESAGLSLTTLDVLPLEAMPAMIIELVPGTTGEFCVAATKRAT